MYEKIQLLITLRLPITKFHRAKFVENAGIPIGENPYRGPTGPVYKLDRIDPDVPGPLQSPLQLQAILIPEPVAVCLKFAVDVGLPCSRLLQESNLLLTMATAKVFAASNVRSGLMCRSALM